MKKRVTAISALILVVVLAAALVACVDDGDTNVGPFTYDIGSAEDFEGLRSKLGADYDQGVYNLNADLDLTGSEWTPIGDSVTNAFTGKLNGNGHTIRYSIEKETPEHTDVNTVAEEVFTGLFGVISGAEISNLNIVVDIDVPVEGETVYVGGITGYAYGDVKFTDVSVSGTIRADIADIRVTTVGADGGSNTETYGMYMTAHVGGVAGYVIGNASLENVASTVDLDVGKMDGYAVSNDYCRVNEVTAGGIAGTLRTVDLSSGVSNKTSIKVNSLKYSGDISVYGATVNAGGLIGLGYRISGEDLRAEISDYDAMFVNGVNRLNAGVVAGMLDRADISRIVASAPVLERVGDDVEAYVVPHEQVALLTGFRLARGLLCAMRRPPRRSVFEVVEGARRVAVLEDLVRRDEYDSTREASPLRPAKDAVRIDSSDLSFDEVVDRIVRLVEAAEGGPHERA